MVSPPSLHLSLTWTLPLSTAARRDEAGVATRCCTSRLLSGTRGAVSLAKSLFRSHPKDGFRHGNYCVVHEGDVVDQRELLHRMVREEAAGCCQPPHCYRRNGVYVSCFYKAPKERRGLVTPVRRRGGARRFALPQGPLLLDHLGGCLCPCLLPSCLALEGKPFSIACTPSGRMHGF